MTDNSAPPPSLQPVDFDPFAEADATTLALTEQQREMYAVVQMGDAANCAYNQCFALTLRGPLSEQSLRAALQQVVQRHDALRLRIVDDERQEVLASIDATLALVDVSTLDAAQREATIRNLLDHETRTAFDLTVAPLWRAQLVREAEQLHRLVFTAHHIVADGWSSAVIFGDLARAYVADQFGLAAQLPPAAAYAEFVANGQSPTAIAEARAAEDYWVARFAGGVPYFELPFDRPRPPAKTYNAGRRVLAIDAPLYQAVRKIGAQQGATLFVTLLAAFEVLIARLSASEELVIGVPMASQALEENGHLVAHGVNTIPLRCRVDMQNSFIEHLRSTRNTFLEAQAHQRLTFGSLVHRLKLPRDRSRTPLVSVMFNIDKLGAPFDFGEVVVAGIDTPKAFYNFEFGINAIDDGTTLLLECDYNTDLFTSATINRWLGHYRRLLEAIASDPAQRTDELPLLTDDERHQLLVEWSGAKATYSNSCLHEQFEEQVRRTPEAVAAEYEGSVLSYAELNARANQLAWYLRERGVGPEAPVALCVERGLAMLVGVLGILKAGGGYLPLDPTYPTERLSYMLADAEPQVLLTQQSLRERVGGTAAPVISLDEDWGAIAIGSPQNVPVLVSGVRPEHLAYVIYTSGSTGKPKGVMIEHRHVMNLWQGLERDCRGEGSGAHVALNASLNFDASVQQLVHLLKGRRVSVVPERCRLDPWLLIQFLQEREIEEIDCTPSMLKAWIAAGLLKQPRALRRVLVGGEAIDPELWSTLAGSHEVSFYNVYGPTECTVDATIARLTEDWSAPHIGRPMANRCVYILDPRQQLVPVGVVGEIYIGGAGVGRGYLKRAELTAEGFVPNPFSEEPHARMYRTGDLGRWRIDGAIEYLGRFDLQVKLRGFRIELGEIEAVIAQHPAVHQVAVIDREDVPGEKRLAAYLVVAQSEPALVQELRERLRRTLPDYMAPAYFLFVPALPLTPNGKLDRKALPAPADISNPSRGLIEPRTASERLVVATFADVLNRRDFGVHDNFFDLGGHSLMAARVMARLRSTTKVDLPLRNLFDWPTPEGLAAAIDTLAWTAGSAAARTSGDGDREEIEL